MANLILPSRFTQQPQYPVAIDVSNPITSGIKLALNFSTRLPADLVGNAAVAYAANAKIAAGIGGVGLFSDGIAATNSQVSFPLFSTTNITFCVYQQRKTTGSNYWLELGPDGTADHFPFSGGYYIDAFAAGRWLSNAALPSGKDILKPHLITFVITGENHKIYFDKTLWAEANTTTIYRPTAVIHGTSAGGFDGWTYAAYGFNRAFSEAEVSALADNPWQIFRKRPQVLYFDVGSGGATGTGSLTTGVTTASGSGTLTHTGTGSLSSGVTTLSGTGTLAHTGTGALTISAVTLDGDGEIVGAVSGTGSLTTGVTTLSGSGVISHIGTGSLTVGNVTASGTGTAGSGIGVPANLEGSPTSTTIVWTWDAVSGATGYEIEYGPDGGGYTVTDVGTNLTYTQTSLSAATLYEARVRAYVDTVSDRIILESGDGYLLESGDSLLQEAA